jgi:hypothetical protein
MKRSQIGPRSPPVPGGSGEMGAGPQTNGLAGARRSRPWRPRPRGASSRRGGASLLRPGKLKGSPSARSMAVASPRPAGGSGRSRSGPARPRIAGDCFGHGIAIGYHRSWDVRRLMPEVREDWWRDDAEDHIGAPRLEERRRVPARRVDPPCPHTDRRRRATGGPVITEMEPAGRLLYASVRPRAAAFDRSPGIRGIPGRVLLVFPAGVDVVVVVRRVDVVMVVRRVDVVVVVRRVDVVGDARRPRPDRR